MKVHSIHTGYFKLDGGAMFGVVPKSIWNTLNPADEKNLCRFALRSLLIEEEDRRILIDTGIGTKQDAKFFSHYDLHGEETLDRSLQQKGFSREDITDVILTHLHFDHCGGSVDQKEDQLVPAFPRATYWTNEKHWAWALHPNDREKASFLKENLLPLQEAGQLRFLPDSERVSQTGRLDRAPFSQNITIRYAYGHTQSMMLPQIRVGRHTLVYMADLIPTVAHLPIPYIMAYDMFPLVTLQEKKDFLEEAVTEDYVLFFEHDPEQECCRLKRTDRGIL
jgi:glyoxylase-like metal-dependent hydrolase (beta-lactamase superfamily II)